MDGWIVDYRMNYFVAGLTNTDPATTAPVYKQYDYVQYNDTLAAAATGSVSFPPSSDTFRYVIIQNQFTSVNAICMKEVKVFVRGMCVILKAYFTAALRCDSERQSAIVRDSER